MQRIFQSAVALLFLAVPSCWSQWELGAFGGFGFARDLAATNPGGSAAAGFRNGKAWGFVGGHNTYRYVSGEVRYLFRDSDPTLSGGGAEARFRGRSHVIHADFLVHFRPTGARVRPFLAVGGGAKVFEGTGTERAVQPLNRFALLTKTQETLPMLSAGAGVKVELHRRVALRVEFRDFITGAPERIIAPAPGASLSGLVHDVIPMAGFVFTF